MDLKLVLCGALEGEWRLGQTRQAACRSFGEQTVAATHGKMQPVAGVFGQVSHTVSVGAWGVR